EQEFKIGGAILVQNGDTVAGREAELLHQAARQGGARLVELAVGLAFSLEPNRLQRWVPLRTPADQFGNGPHTLSPLPFRRDGRAVTLAKTAAGPDPSYARDCRSAWDRRSTGTAGGYRSPCNGDRPTAAPGRHARPCGC